jgi:hypothetical protein
MFRNNRIKVLMVCIVSMTFLLLNLSGCASTNYKKQSTIQVSASVSKGTEAYKLIFKESKPNNPLSLKFQATPYKAMVKPYKVNAELSNITNISQFGNFTKDQKKLLVQNGFCVIPTQDQQLFYTYEDNQYLKVPSFITSDSVLQVYNVFFDYSLRTLESETLLPKLYQLTDSMLKKSIGLYNKIKNSQVKAAALRDSAFFAVAQTLLNKSLPQGLPSVAKDLANQELQLIHQLGGFKASPIFNYKLDYSQYVPRGHYTRSNDLKNYFKAMMWYGQAPFVLYKPKSDEKELDINSTLQALLTTYNLYNNNIKQSDIDLWEVIYNPTEFYVGKTDDLNVYQYKTLLLNVYGNKVDLEKLTDIDKLQLIIKEGKKFPEPRIQGSWQDPSIPTGKQFRFMGQRYIPDSEILQKLSSPPERSFPKGLDVMGVLGSNRAKDILLNQYKENVNWSGYTKGLKKLQEQFNNTKVATWQSNMYYGWLWSLNPLIKSFDKGFPSFMLNTAWEDKSLNTALSSWTELRHDTILYAKQSGAECGGDEEPPVIKSYVEPNVDFYGRLLWLTKFSRKNLSDRKILSSELESKIQNLEDLLTFLDNCSVKELRNEELTKDEYYQLLIYGGNLEYLSTSLAGGLKGWYEITSETDRNMAVVADVHTTSGSCLEEGVGPAAQIFVVVPMGNKLYLTRGAVFQYYEFESSTRLTDEQWQKMLKENKAPSQPVWTKSFTSGKNKKVPVPKKPYSSGC